MMTMMMTLRWWQWCHCDVVSWDEKLVRNVQTQRILPRFDVSICDFCIATTNLRFIKQFPLTLCSNRHLPWSILITFLYFFKSKDGVWHKNKRHCCLSLIANYLMEVTSVWNYAENHLTSFADADNKQPWDEMCSQKRYTDCFSSLEKSERLIYNFLKTRNKRLSFGTIFKNWRKRALLFKNFREDVPRPFTPPTTLQSKQTTYTMTKEGRMNLRNLTKFNQQTGNKKVIFKRRLIFSHVCCTGDLRKSYVHSWNS